MIRVDQPCDERWDGMAGDDRRRSCARCRHAVHDLSAMTRVEATALLAREPRLCVRFTSDAAGRILHRRALAAGALLAASPALASSAPVTAEPGPLERLWDAAVEWWSAEPEAPAPEVVDTGLASAPIPSVRHVTMGVRRIEPPQVVAGRAEVALAAGTAPLVLEVACTDGFRDRWRLEDHASLALGTGECRVIARGGAPREAPVAVGDDLVCAADERSLTCAPR